MATELIAVVAALRRELMHLWGRLRGASRLREAPCPCWRARLGGQGLLLLASGMGEKAATRAADWVLGQKPTRVLSVGFAGACGALGIGDLFIPGEVADEAGRVLPLQGTGRLLTVRRIGPTRGDADAVDMESFHVVDRCRAAGVPASCLRAISDTPAQPLSPFLALALAGERVRAQTLAWAVLRRPWLIGELRRLARDSGRAARALAEGIVQSVGSTSSAKPGSIGVV